MQRLNSDIDSIAAWLEKTEAELEALKLAKPPSDIQEMALRVKRLQVSGAVGGGERRSEQACRVSIVLLDKEVRPGLGVAFTSVRPETQVSLFI